MYRLNDVKRVAVWNEISMYPSAIAAGVVTDTIYNGMRAFNLTVPSNPTQEEIDELVLRLREYDDSQRTSSDDRIAVVGAVYHATCEKVLRSLLKYNYFPAAWTQMECIAEPSTKNLTAQIPAAIFMIDIVEWDHRMTGDSWTDDLWYIPQREANATNSTVPGSPSSTGSNYGSSYYMAAMSSDPARDISDPLTTGNMNGVSRQYLRSAHQMRLKRGLRDDWSSNSTDNSTNLVSSAELVYRDLKETFGVEPQWTVPVTMAAGLVLHKILESTGSTATEALRTTISRFYSASFIGPIGFSIWGQNNVKDVILLQLDKKKELQVIYPLGFATAPIAFPAPAFRDRVYTYHYLHTTAEIILAAICATLILISVVLGIILIIYQDRKTLAAASPLFLGAILIGSILIYCHYWTWLPQSGYNAAVCHLRYWFLGVGFVFLFGSLFAKSWRIMRLFDPSERNIFKVTNEQLTLALGSFVVVEVVLLAIWSATANPKVVTVVLDPLRPRIDYKTCKFGKGNTPMLIIIVIYNLGLLLYGMYTTVKIWNVPLKIYNESREIAFSMYNLLCFSALAFALQASGAVPDPAMFIIRSSILMLCTFLAVAAIFGPKILALILNKKGYDLETVDQKKPAGKNENFLDEANGGDANTPMLSNGNLNAAGSNASGAGSGATASGGGSPTSPRHNQQMPTGSNGTNRTASSPTSTLPDRDSNGTNRSGRDVRNDPRSNTSSNPSNHSGGSGGATSTNYVVGAVDAGNPPRTAHRSAGRHHHSHHHNERRNSEPRPYEYRSRHSSSSGTIAEENAGDDGFARYTDDDDYFTDEERRRRTPTITEEENSIYDDEDDSAQQGGRRIIGQEYPGAFDDDDDDDSADVDGGMFRKAALANGAAYGASSFPNAYTSDKARDSDADDSSDDSYSPGDIYANPPPLRSIPSSHHSVHTASQSNLHGKRDADNASSAPRHTHSFNQLPPITPVVDARSTPTAPANGYYSTTESGADSARGGNRQRVNSSAMTGSFGGSGAGEGDDSTPRGGDRSGFAGSSDRPSPRIVASNKKRRFTVSGRTSGSEEGNYSPRIVGSRGRADSREGSQSARRATDDDAGTEMTDFRTPKVPTPTSKSPKVARVKKKKPKSEKSSKSKSGKGESSPNASSAPADEPATTATATTSPRTKKRRKSHKTHKNDNGANNKELSKSAGKEDSDEVDDFPAPAITSGNTSDNYE